MSRDFVVDVRLGSGDVLKVEKCGKTQYQILVNGSAIHPACQAEPVIRALGELMKGMCAQEASTVLHA